MVIDLSNYIVVWRSAPARWMDQCDVAPPKRLPFFVERRPGDTSVPRLKSSELRPRMLMTGLLYGWSDFLRGRDAEERDRCVKFVEWLFGLFARRTGHATVPEVVLALARDCRARHGPLVSARLLFSALELAERSKGVEKTAAKCNCSNPGFPTLGLSVALIYDVWRLLEHAEHLDIESACETIVSTYVSIEASGQCNVAARAGPPCQGRGNIALEAAEEVSGEIGTDWGIGTLDRYASLDSDTCLLLPDAAIPARTQEELDYVYCIALHLLARRTELRVFYEQTAVHRVVSEPLRARLARLISDESTELSFLRLTPQRSLTASLLN